MRKALMIKERSQSLLWCKGQLSRKDLGILYIMKITSAKQLFYFVCEAYTSRRDATKRGTNLKLRVKALRGLLVRIQSSLEV